MAAAKGPEALRALTQSLLSRAAAQPPKPAPAEDGNEEPAPAAPATEPEREVAPTTEGDPAPAPEGDEPPAAEPAAAPEEEEIPDTTEVTPVAADRIRIRLSNDVDRMAAAFKKRNQDWTLEECIAAAKDKLGIKSQPTAPAPNAPATPIQAQAPQTVEEVDQQIAAIETQMEQAIQDVDLATQAKLNREIRKLERQRADLRVDAVRQEQQNEATYNATFDQSMARASELYPDAGKTDSAFAQRMVEIERALKDTDDPLYFDPAKPLKIAQMAASEMNIAPKRPGAKAPAPAAKPAAPAAPKTTPKTMVPSGSSRAAPAPAAPPVQAEISKVTNSHQLRQLFKKLGGREF